MDEVPENISFPQVEDTVVLPFWKDIDAFQTSLRLSEGKPEFTFYDGPPFATGLPHYGHILAGTIKDTVCRYAHQTGHHVIRRFGWDCHGLPIEFMIDEMYGIKTKDEILEKGIPWYNARCREIVLKYAAEWEIYMTRLGRWIDFRNDYKTMDITFMESVWWVFRQLFDKGLVYRGFKVMPYSVGCATPLANFEAGLDYRDVNDPSVFVTFPLIDEPDVELIAWTTTPWTLPSNLALCVNPKFIYAKVKEKDNGKKYIVAEGLLDSVFKPAKGAKKNEKPYEILEKLPGSDLEGKKYKPLFEYFVEEFKDRAFKIVTDEYVKLDTGTGVVHQAPAFGEDDFRICTAKGIIVKGGTIPCPINANGFFIDPVVDFRGQFVKDADDNIKRSIKDKHRMFRIETISHSYPFCWRSKKPLIYRAIPSWFVKVEGIRDKLIEANSVTHWVPTNVKEKRFQNWLSEARDWSVSRNRFWGTPLPIWANEDFTEIVCIGSVKELEELSGHKITDLHRDKIDDITIPSKSGNGVLRRVEEVFDCWFESGSMPYAQNHYPFENSDPGVWKQKYPADFIAEGLDQTRGWFYTLLVLSTALFGQAPYKNVVVNGMILAKDGKKMSKSLKNYPDPLEVVHKFGADALRLYLISSPVVKAENLNFNEADISHILKRVLLPWFHSYRFLQQSIALYEKTNGKQFLPDIGKFNNCSNIMDKWIISATQSLVHGIKEEMKQYSLSTVLPVLLGFVEELTNWYVRFNRSRLKGVGGEQDCFLAVNTLFEVLLTITKAMSPFAPFFSEYLYQNMRKILPESERKDSVHFVPYPEPIEELRDAAIEACIKRMQSVIDLGRAARERRVLPLKNPLQEIIAVLPTEEAVTQLTAVQEYIHLELNVRQVTFSTKEESFVTLVAQPDFKVLGARLRTAVKDVRAGVEKLTQEQIRSYMKTGRLEIAGHKLIEGDINVHRKFGGDSNKYEAAWDQNALIVLDVEQTEDLELEGLARAILNKYQKFRKELGLKTTDDITVWYETLTDKGKKVFEGKLDFMKEKSKSSFFLLSTKAENVVELGRKSLDDDGCLIVLSRT